MRLYSAGRAMAGIARGARTPPPPVPGPIPNYPGTDIPMDVPIDVIPQEMSDNSSDDGAKEKDKVTPKTGIPDDEICPKTRDIGIICEYTCYSDGFKGRLDKEECGGECPPVVRRSDPRLRPSPSNWPYGHSE